MKHALLEILTGAYQSGQRLQNKPSSRDIVISVMDHLTRLLNARQNSILHMPDYGLPDIANLYQGLPYSKSELSDSIKNLIIKYETRIRYVTVLHKGYHNENCIVQLEVNGELANGDKVFFDTYFMSGGYANVEFRDIGYE